jgi:hypothetical protein
MISENVTPGILWDFLASNPGSKGISEELQHHRASARRLP